MHARVPVGTALATVLAPVGIIVASFAIPAGVDELPTSDSKMAKTLETVSHHAFATRLGFLAFAVAMLLVIGAMSAVRLVVADEPRGRGAVEWGSRLIAVAAGAIAIGNSFAPASEPSAVRPGLPRDVMIDYMRHHLVNGWDWAIIAFYPLMTIGALVLGVGLWRGGVVSRSATLLIVVPLAVLIAPPLSPPTAILGVALGAGLILAVFGRPAGVATPRPASAIVD